MLCRGSQETTRRWQAWRLCKPLRADLLLVVKTTEAKLRALLSRGVLSLQKTITLSTDETNLSDFIASDFSSSEESNQIFLVRRNPKQTAGVQVATDVNLAVAA